MDVKLQPNDMNSDQPFESQAARHRLPDCWAPSLGDAASSGRQQFLRQLDHIPVDHQAMFELQKHGFLHTKKWLPQEPFHSHFRKGGQVNRYESTMAYAYTQGTAFAYKVNELCHNGNWSALFEQYGRCVKCLWSYAEKMQARYGERRQLFRGMPGEWDDFLAMYTVGSTCEWRAFTSTTHDRGVATQFASGAYGHQSGTKRPVLFCINTVSRGAPVLRWSKYPNEGEVVLLPFQRFQVTKVGVQDGVLVIHMQTVRPVQPCFAYTVVCHPGLAYRYSRDVKDRDDAHGGPRFGDVIEGTPEGSEWIEVSLPGVGNRFLPVYIEGHRKLELSNAPHSQVITYDLHHLQYRNQLDDDDIIFQRHEREPCSIM